MFHRCGYLLFPGALKTFTNCLLTIYALCLMHPNEDEAAAELGVNVHLSNRDQLRNWADFSRFGAERWGI